MTAQRIGASERIHLQEEPHRNLRWAGTSVALYTIIGGGHAWPGGQRGSRFGDRPTQQISATDILWEFFAAHPKQ